MDNGPPPSSIDKMQEAKRQSYVKDIILLVEEDLNKTVTDTLPYQEFVSQIGNLDERDLPQVLIIIMNSLRRSLLSHIDPLGSFK